MSFQPLLPPDFCRLARGSTVLLEIPEGLRTYEDALKARLEACGAASVVVRLEPTYGSCETLACSSNVDLVVHVGHVPYALRPLRECKGVRIVYVPVLAVVDEPARESVEKLAEYVASKGWSKVAIGYVYNYARHAALLSSALRRRGVHVESTHILGCYFGGLESKVGAFDAYIVVGSRFHALGLGLAIHAEKRIILYEPWAGYGDFTDEVVRELRKRYWVAASASTARTWGVILGGRSSQCRPILATLVAGMLRAAGRRVRLYISDRLCRQDLDQLQGVDAFVVTSCPRLAIEDLGDYHRPVLVPGEVPYALGLAERLKFPW